MLNSLYFFNIKYYASILGGISLYTTGVTILDKTVEEIKPPISTKANGDINGLLLSAMGVNPPIAVKLVSTIGRNLISPASLIAALSSFPSALKLVGKIHQ